MTKRLKHLKVSLLSLLCIKQVSAVLFSQKVFLKTIIQKIRNIAPLLVPLATKRTIQRTEIIFAVIPFPVS